MPVTLDDIIRKNSEEEFLKFFEIALSQKNRQILEARQTILRACYRNPELCSEINARKEKEVIEK